MNGVQIGGIVWAVVFFAAFVSLGVFCTAGKRWSGILIDSRNKISLSRFQIIVWTWILISAFMAVALPASSVDFDIPTEVWALLGISLGSTAGAVIIKGNKQPQKPDTAKLQAQFANATSVMHDNPGVKNAGWADMFKGEEVTDFEYVDIAKVQMFFFSFAAFLGYIWALNDWMEQLPQLTAAFEKAAAALKNYPGTDAGQLSALQAAHESARQAAFGFPKLSAQMVTILGISHAGYLTVKAAPKTPTA